jgi:hypothetical protein
MDMLTVSKKGDWADRGLGDPRMYSIGTAAGKRAIANFESFGTGATDRTGGPSRRDNGDRRSMHRTRHAEACLIGLLAALATFCALQAGAAETHSIVAQSDQTTAGTGRRPLSQRIAAAALPIQIDSSAQPRDGDPPSPETPIAAAEPLAGSAPERLVASQVAATGGEGVVRPAAVKPAAASVPAPAHEPAAEAAAAPVVEPPVAEFVPDTPAADSFAVAEEPFDSASVDEPLESEHGSRDDGSPGAGAVHAASPADGRAQDAPALVAEPDESLPAADAAPATESLRGMLLRRVKVALAGIPRPIDARALRARAIPPREVSPRDAAADPATGEAAAQTDATPAGNAAALAAAQPGAVPTPSAAGTPARLEFDICESRAIVGEGEQLVMRIDVRNVGGTAAEGVTATLFFAEGVEPVQSIGHAAKVYPGEVRFAAVDTLAPGNALHLLVTAVGTKPGSVTYRGELECRQLAGRLAREGAVTVSPRQAAAPQPTIIHR